MPHPPLLADWGPLQRHATSPYRQLLFQVLRPRLLSQKLHLLNWKAAPSFPAKAQMPSACHKLEQTLKCRQLQRTSSYLFQTGEGLRDGALPRPAYASSQLYRSHFLGGGETELYLQPATSLRSSPGCTCTYPNLRNRYQTLGCSQKSMPRSLLFRNKHHLGHELDISHPVTRERFIINVQITCWHVEVSFSSLLRTHTHMHNHGSFPPFPAAPAS